MRKTMQFALLGLVLLAVAILLYQYWYTPRSQNPVPATDPVAEGSELEHGQIVIASSPNNPPFYFSDGGSIYKGFDQDLVSALELALDVDLRLVPMYSEDALSALTRGEIDGIMGLEQQPDLAVFCDFTQPYLNNAQAIFVESNHFGIHSFKDLKRRVVVVVTGSPAAYLVQSDPSIHPLAASSPEEAMNLLLSGEAEAFVGDELAGRSLVQRNHLESLVKVVGEPRQQHGYSIAVRKSNQQLLALLNQGLKSLEASGLKAGYYRRWFGDFPRASEATPSAVIVIPLVAAGVLAMLTVGSLLWGRTMRRKVFERTLELRESEHRQRILIENANDAIFSIHPGDTSILRVNRKAEELTNYRRDSLLHMRFSDLFPEDARDESVSRLMEVLLNGSGTFDDMVFVRRDGTPRDVDISASVIEFDRRKVIQILARDITERKAMERELLRRNRNLSALNTVSATAGRSLELDEILNAALDKVLDVVDADMGAIYLFDEESGSLVLRVYRGEPPVLAVQSQGFPEDDSRPISVSNGSVEQLANAWWPSASQSHLGSFVSTHLRAKDRLLGVMNVASQKQRQFTQDDVDLLAAVSNQISIAIENALLFSELRTAIGDLFVVKQFNENVLQSMTSGLITVDLSGRINSLNLAAARILGYSREQMLGKHIHEAVASSNGLERILTETMQEGRPCLNRETVVTHRDGHEIPIDLNTSPLRDSQGVVTGLLLVFSDLSEIKKMQSESQTLNRLAMLGEMASMLSHQIRKPLSAISAGIQIVARKATDPDDKQTMQIVLDETERLDRLLQSVLTISKPLNLNRVPTQATEVLDNAITRWQGRAAQQRVRISKNYDTEIPSLLLDPLLFDQAISNLISNALDAMPHGGELRVTMRKIASAPEAVKVAPGLTPSSQSKAIAAPQEWLRIDVADTGVGIPNDRLPEVFEPFKSTKPDGTGLGLPLVRRVVEDHGGYIDVRSKEGIGTAFTIDIPIAA